MTFISDMQIRVRPGVRNEAISAFRTRRVFEECSEVIPGFLRARLLEAQGAFDAMSVIAEWTDKAAYEAWIAHPVRAAQEADLAQFLAAAPETELYETKADFERTS